VPHSAEVVTWQDGSQDRRDRGWNRGDESDKSEEEVTQDTESDYLKNGLQKDAESAPYFVMDAIRLTKVA
jgi:hypothetical protein